MIFGMFHGLFGDIGIPDGRFAHLCIFDDVMIVIDGMLQSVLHGAIGTSAGADGRYGFFYAGNCLFRVLGLTDRNRING